MIEYKDEPEKIVPINASVGAELAIRRAQIAERPCVLRHKNVVVDSKARTVICADCGFVLDPFDYLADWAAEGDRRMRALQSIRVETKVAQAECAALDQRIKSARDKLRRLGEPQPQEERHLFRHARLNWEKADAILNSPNVPSEPRGQ